MKPEKVDEGHLVTRIAPTPEELDDLEITPGGWVRFQTFDSAPVSAIAQATGGRALAHLRPYLENICFCNEDAGLPDAPTTALTESVPLGL